MRILFDIVHPAHAHFFLNPAKILLARGHKVLITSRDKDVTLALLDKMGLEHHPISSATSNKIGLAKEFFSRNFALLRVVRNFRPDCMAAICGIFIAQIGMLTRIPSLVFYDTENARLQNLLTYPFASLVSAPRCYEGWLPRHSRRYSGYHELSYLHPKRFTPDRDVAIANGLDPERDTFLVRLVAWQASHDVGEQGWTPDLLGKLVDFLAPKGKVLISSESRLPSAFDSFLYSGDPLKLHHVMGHCRLYVGESATMASECAVLGVPSIYAANTGRGYTNEQERRYGLVRNLHHLDPHTLLRIIDVTLSIFLDYYEQKRATLLADTIDVAEYAADLIEARGIKPNTLRNISTS